MKYALNLAENGRILSATYNEHAPADHPRVDKIPDDNVNDYLFVNGEFVYDPVPEETPPEPEPSMNDILNTLLGVSE